MSGAVFGAVLFAALLHASWNMLVRASGASHVTTLFVAAFAGVIAAVTLPFLAWPSHGSWPFIAASVLLQTGYFALLARSYHIAEMSRVYPLMRGAAPLIVALCGALLAVLGQGGDHLSPAAWCGIGALCLGIVMMAADGGLRNRASALALINAGVIAAYTMVDGAGVRRAGAPGGYIAWETVLTGMVFTALRWRGRGLPCLRDVPLRVWLCGLAAGFGTLASYGVVLWAMTRAPVAMVAALRECSILFGLILSGVVLHERIGPRRCLAACVIVCGAVILRVA